MRIIRGKYGRRRFDVPTNITARPTTDFARENIFNVIDNLVDLDGTTALDLFAGTGAISFEMLSRGCAHVTAVEKASTQYAFIKKVAGMLNLPREALTVVKGDVWRFIAACHESYDLIFADPPYDLPHFEEVPQRVMANKAMWHEGTLFVLEHSKAYDFSGLPYFIEHRAYGSVNFSIFRLGSDISGNSDGSEASKPDVQKG